MIYSYFLNLKSYINTYISATYTESIVSNIKPKGNHNAIPIIRDDNLTVRNVKPQGNHNNVSGILKVNTTVRNVKPQGNHNNYDIAREVMKTVSNIKPKGNSKGFNSTPLYKKNKEIYEKFQ